MKEYITTHTENALGHVHKILINSALVSAQNRNRYYWTSFEVEQPEDKGILLKDIIEHDCTDINSDGWHKWFDEKKEFQLKKKYSAICNDGSTDKAITMTARQFASWNGNFIRCGQMQPYPRNYKELGLPRKERYEAFGDGSKSNSCLARSDKNLLTGDNVSYRKLTPRECFRLQTVPEHHIDTLLSAGISNTQLYKMCGNGWTMKVISDILKGII